MSSDISRGMKVAALVSALTLSLAACSPEKTPGSQGGEQGGATTITITSNSIAGGKNSAEADWIEKWVIPNFEKEQKAKGKNVKVKFDAHGVDDEDYKTKISLDLNSGGGADIIAIDGIWVGEFAEAGYIKPLKDVVPKSSDWDGWKQVPDAVKKAMAYKDQQYGVPLGTDGRVIYYNKTLFQKAGLPEKWQPKSWDEILEAARALKKINGVVPIQLNAGTAMGEATTMQGFLPMLVGTGEMVWKDGKWMGDTQGLRKALELYKTIYVDEKLGDAILQQEASGRDTSFQEFAKGHIGILLEGDYFWRSVINPAQGVGTAPIKDRENVVGYAKIPAMKPGSGVNGQDFVSMSGGGGRVLNPHSKNAEMAWELLTFMNSPQAFEQRAAGTLSISPREDVNEKLLKSDPMLTFVSSEVLPITSYRPGLAEYPQVSAALQQATLDVVSGKSVDDAVKSYVATVKGVVGADKLSGN